MAIRPTDIRRKEFKNSLRGYDANQVDDFLDAVADEFERTYSENVRLREESSSLRSRLEQFDELEGSIRAALVHAEQAANDLRRTATQEAEGVRQTANREAELTINDAKARSHRMLADTSERVERIQESYEALRNAKQLFASDFRHLLKSYMEVMDNSDIATAREIETSLRERVDLESIAAARVAAEAERSDAQEELPVEDAEPAGESTAEHEPFDEDGDQATQLMDMSPSSSRSSTEDEAFDEPVAQDTPEAASSTEDVSVADEPEVEEPEVEPSTAEASPTDSASFEEPDSEAPEPGDDKEQDDATLARDSGSQEFWDDAERRNAGGNGEEGRISRASRFLRRRG